MEDSKSGMALRVGRGVALVQPWFGSRTTQTESEPRTELRFRVQVQQKCSVEPNCRFEFIMNSESSNWFEPVNH